jgi:hypothetical protein
LWSVRHAEIAGNGVSGDLISRCHDHGKAPLGVESLNDSVVLLGRKRTPNLVRG